MPRKIQNKELQAIVNLVSQHPEGISPATIQAGMDASLNRQTLTRRIGILVQQNRIQRRGSPRRPRYFPVQAAPAPEASSSYAMPSKRHAYMVREPLLEPYIPLSAEAEEVCELLQRPAMHRTPAGYRRELLDEYVPNVTKLLPDHFRTQLHLMGRLPDSDRPAGSYARRILNRLITDLSWASSRLEGNTYSLLDTKKLIEAGEAMPGKDVKETQMILNHKAALELLVDSAEEVNVDRFTLLNLHALLTEGLGDVQDAGRLRTSMIGIGGSVYSPPAIPQFIEEMFRLLVDKAAAIEDPFEQSFFLMVHLPYLQPFVEANKRVSRLAANIPLIKKNCVPLSFLAVPEQAYAEGVLAVYELNRIELLRDVYVWAYERSCRRYRSASDRIPEPDPFRLKYRTLLAEAIREIVLKGLVPQESQVRPVAERLVEPEDVQRFMDLTLRELRDLHEGNIARYRLKAAEFESWKTAASVEYTAPAPAILIPQAQYS